MQTLTEPCGEPHMTIREALACGCARAVHREEWDVDAVRNPDLFANSPALVAYMSTMVTNKAPHAVVNGDISTPRRNTPFCSVRKMPKMATGMGHQSNSHLNLAIAIGQALDEVSSYSMYHSGCVTRFDENPSENQVAMVEVPVCESLLEPDPTDTAIPHLRFPGGRRGDTVAFCQIRVIHPACGTLPDAIANCRVPHISQLVPIGYNPKRWQAVVAAHETFHRTLLMGSTEERADWDAYVATAIDNVVSRHRARGVCISRAALRPLLVEMAQFITPAAPRVPYRDLYDLCIRYSRERPRALAVPADLSSIQQCAMRNRRKSLCHRNISLV